MPVRIDVIDCTRRDNGFLNNQRRVHSNPVFCSDLATMVMGVIDRANGQQIDRLRIFGHGHAGHQFVGGGTHAQAHQLIAAYENGELHNRDLLSMLRGCFTADALVQLHGCRVARGTRGNLLVYQLAHLWQVRVQAGYDRQFADRGDHFEGSRYLEADGRPGSLIPLLDHRTR